MSAVHSSAVMPLTYREAVQIGLLLACVPLQYMLSMNKELDQSSSIGRIFSTDFQNFRDNWLSTESWAKSAIIHVLMNGFLPNPAPIMYYGTIGENESPAHEVLRYRQERGFFTASQSIRWKRPNHLHFRIGQVVKHRTEGYTGVIIGWDVKAKASETWLFREYGDLQVCALCSYTDYRLSIDERDPISTATMAPEATYVVQQELELMPNTEVGLLSEHIM
ncbi:Clp protease adapter protein ClpF, chloroplastic [Frankliniella fusca]|uniref:Clp protease adapter protein ClpF, chloroplastic n=1 Tax=Frankliniella fusca TaxID=407009 RepID=A0AAE1H6E2_9NEOP|nr:Clp protease adapter protein ClpF, chloroplastic [Frankliniella fusca]